MDRPLKILQISTTDHGGGAEGSAWNLFQAYRDRGHGSWLAVGWKHTDDPDVIEIPQLRRVSPWAHVCWVLHGRLSSLEGKVRSVRRVREWLRVLSGGRSEIDRRLGREDFDFPGTRHLLNLTPKPPDIIHAHNLHGGYFDLRFLAPLSHRLPVILNLRDMWLLTGHCAYPMGCNRWRTGCGSCPDLTIYPAIERDSTAFNWSRKRRIYANSRLHVAAVSQWLAHQTQESMLRGEEDRVIHNAVDLGIFAPGDRRKSRSELGLSPEARVVLLTAQTPFKDYDTMENALRALRKPPHGELLFICLGRVDQDGVLGEARILYPGFERNPRRMALYYRAADVFIHAAKDEAFGKTIAEAMSCGTPVVATAVGGIPELIEDGVTGYLVPPRDGDAMARRVQALLDDPSLAGRIGRMAAIVAPVRFGLDRQVDAFLEWYREILERGNNGRAVSDHR